MTDTMPSSRAQKLRYGFSTGACLTALACGLWRCAAPKNNTAETDFSCITVTFLDGVQKSLPLLTQKLSQGILQIQKDGGDDPDCTHKAILTASLFRAEQNHAQKEDYILEIGKALLILHATHGIGLCTRKGLDCEEGKWAINTGPRTMLAHNLMQYGMGKTKEVWQLNIGVENGEELAKKTLNPKLGIIGGISILGTTGHVKPFSHDAYIHTIKICTNAVKLEHGTHVVYGTGARSLKQAKTVYPNLPENAFIPIADFIGKSIEFAKEARIPEISIACMAGKLCKYAAKQQYTHAHKEEQDMSVFEAAVAELGLPQEEKQNFSRQNAKSVREALCCFSDKSTRLILEKLAEKALAFFQTLNPAAAFTILVCDFDGSLILTAKTHGENHA